MEAGWCARVLRAVTPELWLGPDLMRDIEVEALRAVAELQPCGRATRARLRDGGAAGERTDLSVGSAEALTRRLAATPSEA